MIKEKEHEGVKAPSTRKMIRCPRKIGINMNMREGRGDKVKTIAIGGSASLSPRSALSIFTAAFQRPRESTRRPISRIQSLRPSFPITTGCFSNTAHIRWTG